MKKVHSFLGRCKKQYRQLGLGRYRPAYFITAYSLAAVILILAAEHFYSEDTNSIQVQTKTSFESSGLKGATEEGSISQEEHRSLDTQEDKLVQYLGSGTLDGLTTLAVGYITELKEQEDEINLVILEQDTIRTNKARQIAEEQRLLAIAKAKEAERIKKEAERKALELQKQQEELKKNAMMLSASERKYLEMIVQAESGNQDIKGKILVANVVLNRIKSSRFPDTVKAVVFQHTGSCYQFSPAKSGSIYRVHISKETKEAVTRALNGEDYSKGALYFVARSAANRNSLTWFDRELTRLFTHGGHTFYK